MWQNLLNLWKSDNLQDLAWKRSFEMLKTTEEMFLEAVRVLRESDDTEVRQEIRELDKTVNSYQRDVRRMVLIHLTTQGTASIPSALVLLVIIIDIERIGDYTKNMVDLVTHRPDTLHGGTFEKDLCKIEAAVKDCFARTRTCVESSGDELALRLLEEHEWVNRACDDAVKGLIQEKEGQKLSQGEAVALALYFRWLKRINSHLRNIATSVVNPYDRIGYEPKGV